MISFLALLTVPASGQDVLLPEANVQLFRASIDSETSLWTDDSGTSSGHFGRARLVAGLLRDPLVYKQGGERVALLSDVFHVDLAGGYNLGRLRLGAQVPVYLLAGSDVFGAGTGLGDVALDLRVNLLDRKDAPLGVAVGARSTLPTSTMQLPLGSPGPVWEAQAVADRDLGPIRVALNLGFRGVPRFDGLPNVALDDQIFARAGLGWKLSRDVGLTADVVGQRTLASPNAWGSPVEALGGGWYRLSSGWVLRAGAGGGITRGVGSPQARALAALSYEPRIRPRDRDGDGIADDRDQCPLEPEDYDLFQDHDGCPDPDNDGDGILDVDDACPDRAEDFDGYKDEDGCPDPQAPVLVRITDPEGFPIPGARASIEGVGVALSGGAELGIDLHPGSYRVRAEADGFEQLEDVLHVPERASKHEAYFVMRPSVALGTVLLNVVSSSREPVPQAWWSIGRHNPVPVKGGSSEARLPVGEHRFMVRADGYAPAHETVTVGVEGTTEVLITLLRARAEVTDDRVALKDAIQFEPGKSRISERSFGLLREIADLLLDRPEIALVAIEGHTDSRGGEELNQRISEERAAAVREFLIERGVAPDRLRAVGHGASQPVDDGDDDDAHERNRRVDFLIERRVDPRAAEAERKALQTAPPAEAAPPVDESVNPWEIPGGVAPWEEPSP